MSDNKNMFLDSIPLIITIFIIIGASFVIFSSVSQSASSETHSSSVNFIGNYSGDTLLDVESDHDIQTFTASRLNDTWLEFNGINTTVILPYINITANREITYTLWIKKKGASVKGIMKFMGTHIRATNKALIFNSNTSGGMTMNTMIFDKSINGNNWTFIGMSVKDGNGCRAMIQGYINESQVQSPATCGNIDQNNTLQNVIGSATGTDLWNGSIDDIRIYNKSLRVGEMYSIYNEFSERSSNATRIIAMEVAGFEDMTLDNNETLFNNFTRFLNHSGYHTITDVDFYNYTLGKFTLPTRPIILTVDDGYLGTVNMSIILKRYGYVGVAYIITTNIGIGGYMGIQNLNSLVSPNFNWTLGGHSVSHCDFITRCNSTNNWTLEFSYTKHNMTTLLGYTPISWAYPINSMNATTQNYCALNYSICWATSRNITIPLWIDSSFNLTSIYLERTVSTKYAGYNSWNQGFNITLGNENNLVMRIKFNEYNGTKAYDSYNTYINNISNATWNSDNVKITLTNNVDYNLSGNTFRIVNSIYDKDYIMLSWTFVTTNPTIVTAIDGIIDSFSNFNMILTIGLVVMVMGMIVGYFNIKKMRR